MGNDDSVMDNNEGLMENEVSDNFSAEDVEDQVSILADKDETLTHDLSAIEEGSDSGARGQFINEEPDSFARGDVDVKTQMDRLNRAVQVDLGGFSERSRNEDPRIPNP